VCASVLLELVHTDLASPITPTGRDGFRYATSLLVNIQVRK